MGVEEGQDSVYTPLNVVEQQTARDLHEHGDLWLEILIESFRGSDPGPSLDVAFCSGAERVRLRYAQGRLQLAADTERDPELVLWLGAISVRSVSPRP